VRFLGLVLSNLRRHRLRTALTVLCVFIAFVLYGYLAAIDKAFELGVDVTGADRLVVRHAVSLVMMLPESYEARMARIDGVELVTHATWFGGIYQEPSNFFPQMAVVPEPYLAMYPEFLLPAEQKAAWLATRSGAVVGRNTADRFGFKIGDRVPIQGTIFPRRDGGNIWEFDVVGIYDGKEKGTDTTQFLFRYDFFDESRIEAARGQVGWYMVRVADPERAVEVAATIDRTFANSFAETKAETEGAFVQAFAKQIGNIGAILIAILGAVFFTILLVAGNTMAQTVRERIQELAVLKALGFSDAGVLLLVLLESCLLAGIGGTLGLGLSWFLISLGDPTHGALPIFYFPTRDLLTGFLLVLALGLAAGLLPALQAMRLRIADALRR